jgi:polyhydroxybutyrate depolymerase
MKLAAPLLALLFLFLQALPAAAQPLGPGDFTRTLDWDGQTRTYLVHVPSYYTSDRKYPLVVDIHGLSATAQIQRGLSGMLALSDKYGFIGAWPQGIDNAFNGGVCCAQGVDDVGFIRAMVAAISADANVEARRVYATGLSNGGAMTQRLACEAADVFAAAVPLAFPISLPEGSCNPVRPIPVLTVMGLTDMLVPYDGNASGTFPSALTTLARWRETDGCGTGPMEEHTASGQSYCDIDTSCDDGTQVGLCSVVAQAFPGQFFDGHILYLNPDYDFAETAWDFMTRFRLPGEDAVLPSLPPALLASLAGVLATTGARLLRAPRRREDAKSDA